MTFGSEQRFDNFVLIAADQKNASRLADLRNQIWVRDRFHRSERHFFPGDRNEERIGARFIERRNHSAPIFDRITIRGRKYGNF